MGRPNSAVTLPALCVCVAAGSELSGAAPPWGQLLSPPELLRFTQQLWRDRLKGVQRHVEVRAVPCPPLAPAPAAACPWCLLV